jgi:hypothetical protein
MQHFSPDNMVVTIPFSQLIDKPKVMERVESDIIQFTRDGKNRFFHHEGDYTIVVIGSEIVVLTPDANHVDAGKTVNRLYTEVWMKCDNKGKKVVCHANNVADH